MKTKQLTFAGYDGFVEMKGMKNSQRFGFMQSIGIDNNVVAQMQAGGDFQIDLGKIGVMLDETGKHVASVNLKKGDHEYQSWDDLDEDADCLQIQIDCMSALLGMGKN